MDPRIFSKERLAPDAPIRLTGNAAAHISKTLRLRAGDSIVVFDGEGLEYPSRIETVARNDVTVAVGTGRDPGTESRLAVTLLQGICRNQRMDLLIQKSTELGVAAIQPIRCERSVVRLDDAREQKRVEHWQKIAISACEQSGRVRIPQITPPATLDETLASLGDTQHPRLLLDPRATNPIGTGLDSAHRISLLIGPEGGLTDAERATALNAGFRPVRMGPRVLRTETAPLVALSILQYVLGDLT